MGAFLTQAFQDSAAIADDAEALQRRAAESGYLYISGLLEAGLIFDVRQQVAEICQELGWLAEGRPAAEAIARPGIRIGDYGDPDYVKLAQQVLPLPAFGELGRHPAIIGVLEMLFGCSVEAGLGDVCRVFSPGWPELATKPHQDHYYVGGTAGLWTVWVPLGTCPAELGGLAVLPGSHRQGLLEHTGEGDAKYVAAIPEDAAWAFGDYACGDVIMFNSLTLHRAGPNLTSDRLRLSADYRYRPQAG